MVLPTDIRIAPCTHYIPVYIVIFAYAHQFLHFCICTYHTYYVYIYRVVIKDRHQVAVAYLSHYYTRMRLRNGFFVNIFFFSFLRNDQHPKSAVELNTGLVWYDTRTSRSCEPIGGDTIDGRNGIYFARRWYYYSHDDGDEDNNI